MTDKYQEIREAASQGGTVPVNSRTLRALLQEFDELQEDFNELQEEFSVGLTIAYMQGAEHGKDDSNERKSR